MRIGKRAVSPLIATVLLIAFAVALGAVVMNWGRSYVETTATFAEEKSDIQIICSRDIYLRFNDNVENFLCYNTSDTANSRADFILENSGTSDIEELQVTLVGEKGISVTEITNVSLDIGYVYRGNATYDNDTLGNLQEIKIIPSILVGQSKTPVKCASSPLRKADITACT